MHESGDIKDGGIRSVIFAGSATLFLIVISFGITVFIQFHDVSILKNRVRILEETCLPSGSSRTSHHRSPVSHSFTYFEQNSDADTHATQAKIIYPWLL